MNFLAVIPVESSGMTQSGRSALVSPHCFAQLKSASKAKKGRSVGREVGYVGTG